MISYEHWAVARDTIKIGKGPSKRLFLIEAAIRSRNKAETLRAITKFKTENARKGMEKYGDLLVWLEAHLDDLTYEEPTLKALEEVVYQLNPYQIPAVWKLRLDKKSIEAWNNSSALTATWHTFIGVTHKHSGDSAVYPCFMEDSYRTRVFNPAKINSARAEGTEKRGDKTIPTKVKADLKNSDLKVSILKMYESSDGKTNHAIIEPYQQSNFYMVERKGEIKLDWSVDGMFHKAAARKKGDTEVNFIGWSIKGAKAKAKGFIRFVSGRNLGKFKPEFRKEGHESRDMPEAYAGAIAEMLGRDLKIKLESRPNIGKSGRGKAARRWNYRS